MKPFQISYTDKGLRAKVISVPTRGERRKKIRDLKEKGCIIWSATRDKREAKLRLRDLSPQVTAA